MIVPVIDVILTVMVPFRPRSWYRNQKVSLTLDEVAPALRECAALGGHVPVVEAEVGHVRQPEELEDDVRLRPGLRHRRVEAVPARRDDHDVERRDQQHPCEVAPAVVAVSRRVPRCFRS